MAKRQPKLRIGKLPMNPDASSRRQEQPCWDGIDPAVRRDYEERVARNAAINAELAADPEWQARMEATRNAPPPWVKEAVEHFAQPPVDNAGLRPERKPSKSIAKLKDARRKVQALSADVRGEAFVDWLRRCVVIAERPDEWVRSRALYESYLRQARKYGSNRQDRALSQEALATETMWGKMMGSVFPNKKRTREGWFYPVRLKQGA